MWPCDLKPKRCSPCCVTSAIQIAGFLLFLLFVWFSFKTNKKKLYVYLFRLGSKQSNANCRPQCISATIVQYLWLQHKKTIYKAIHVYMVILLWYISYIIDIASKQRKETFQFVITTNLTSTLHLPKSSQSWALWVNNFYYTEVLVEFQVGTLMHYPWLSRSDFCYCSTERGKDGRIKVKQPERRETTGPYYEDCVSIS